MPLFATLQYYQQKEMDLMFKTKPHQGVLAFSCDSIKPNEK